MQAATEAAAVVAMAVAATAVAVTAREGGAGSVRGAGLGVSARG